MAASPTDRAALMKSFDESEGDRIGSVKQPGDNHRELCVPCAEAVLDAAGVKPTKAGGLKRSLPYYQGTKLSATTEGA